MRIELKTLLTSQPSALSPQSSVFKTWPVFTFWPFMVAMLFCDSRWLAAQGFDGQLIPNILVPFYLLLIVLSVERRLKLLIILIIPLSFLGELLCSPLLRLYIYRHEAVPLYVPFGHGVVFGTGCIVARLSWFAKRERLVQKILIPFYLLLMLGVVALLGDMLTVLFGGLFFAALYRKRWQTLYLIMGVLVLGVELVGTRFGCWQWQPLAFGFLPTINPPVGAIFIYVGGDLILAKATGLYLRRHQ
jgi:hypothetical protein